MATDPRPQKLRVTLETECEHCKGYGGTRKKEKGAKTIECPICKGHGSVKLQAMSMTEFCKHLQIETQKVAADGTVYCETSSSRVTWKETIE